MPRVDYYQYLCSREWVLKKAQVRERAGGICERCEKAPLKDTHHLSYRNLGNEPLEELLGVCRPCHAYLSGKSDWDPRGTPKAQPGEGPFKMAAVVEKGGRSLPPFIPDWCERFQAEAYNHKGLPCGG
jgi:hypothetical protein